MRAIGIALALAAAAVPAAAQSPHLADRLATLAGSGQAEAQYHLGMLYKDGLGVARDQARAFELFSKAAAGGDPLAAYEVGCYYDGEFKSAVAPDPEQALRHKLVAAEAGYSVAQVDVAIHYFKAKDYRSAFRWFEAAARQGDPQGLYNLTTLYRDGLGTAASPARAWAVFRLAHLASKGRIDAEAQATLDGMWAKLSRAQRAEAKRAGTGFVTGPGAVTARARAGLERAEALVREKAR